ncbi:MAG: putative metal-binding motif-containing protein, partial [Myxococcota bacterium]
ACENSGTVVCNSSNDGTTCSVSAGSPSTEACSGIDDDCDGQVDEGCDDDGDGFCDDSMTITTNDACPETTVGDRATFDCNDGDSDINPDATEECDGIDSDCDGTADENDGDATDYCEADEGQQTDCFNDSGSYCCRTPGGDSC